MFKDELKKLRESKGMTQAELAKRLGLSSSTIGMYESGKRQPNFESAEMIADYFNINLSTLLQGKAEPTQIPVLGTIKAGIPIEAMEDIIDYEEISDAMLRKGEYFALQIKGDSMEPRFKEGDVVIVRKQAEVNTGDIAIIMVNGYDATIKKVQLYPGGINLIPLNPTYNVSTYNAEQVASLPVSILGKVVELRAKF